MYLPEELARHSSWSREGDEHLLKTPDAELREKEWDEERLREWEQDVNHGEPWAGRKRGSQASNEAGGPDYLNGDEAAGESPNVTADEEAEEEHYTQTDDDSWIK